MLSPLRPFALRPARSKGMTGQVVQKLSIVVVLDPARDP
jgi:hypothetical protein